MFTGFTMANKTTKILAACPKDITKQVYLMTFILNFIFSLLKLIKGINYRFYRIKQNNIA